MPVQKHIPQAPKAYPLRPKPECGESLLGYLHRFAERNGLPRTTWLTEDLRVPFGSGYLSPDQVAKFSIMCGIPTSDLAKRQTSSGSGSRAQILGTPLQRQHVKGTLSRMCLYCVEQNPYHHLIWNLLPISHCPIHGAAIIDACPTCHSPLEWHRPRLLKCRNDHDIRVRRLTRGANVSEPEIDGIRAIYEHCGFNHGGSAILAETPDAMRNLPAGEFIELVMWLGELGARATPNRNPGDRGQASPLAIGFALTRHWPTKFNKLLEPCITSGPAFLGTELSNWIIKTLSRSSSARKEIIRPVLADLAQSRGRARVFGLRHPSDKNLISSAQARRMLRTSLGKLYQLAGQHGWYGDGVESGWLVRGKVEQWIRERRDRVSMNALRPELGTKPQNITRMIALGVFGAAAAERLPTTRGNPFLYKAELSTFLRVIDASIDRKHPTTSAITWSQYSRRVECGAVDLPTTIKAVIEGRIRPIGRRTNQLGRLTFRPEDLAALSQGSRGADEDFRTAEHHMPVREISSALGIDRKILDSAVSLGLIGWKAGRAGKRLITISDTKAFLTEYTCARLMAQHSGKSAFSIALLLNRSSVPRVGGKRAKGIPIFRVSDLNAGNFGAVLVRARPEKLIKRARKQAKPRR